MGRFWSLRVIWRRHMKTFLWSLRTLLEEADNSWALFVRSFLNKACFDVSKTKSTELEETTPLICLGPSFLKGLNLTLEKRKGVLGGHRNRYLTCKIALSINVGQAKKVILQSGRSRLKTWVGEGSHPKCTSSEKKKMKQLPYGCCDSISMELHQNRSDEPLAERAKGCVILQCKALG